LDRHDSERVAVGRQLGEHCPQPLEGVHQATLTLGRRIIASRSPQDTPVTSSGGRIDWATAQRHRSASVE
jgi:hypothetical protein